ncbi:low temperature requirement protein A [Caulobacter sp. RL271]|uniref:Low temperature requirement protein A n=1 Tax=Caulobacter segnis TaxID=88688 RepID=A0ABY4ZZ47_9CAUL|nr:low temperature requirement protein A [Caulobacter segnis]USQ97828.1 low temperature requirement protein A [Caulobacter segnis]
MTQLPPEDYSDDELLAMLNPVQLAELDRQIGEMFGAEGVDRVEALFAMANVYSLRAAARDEVSALAMLQLAAAMRRRADAMLASRN